MIAPHTRLLIVLMIHLADNLPLFLAHGRSVLTSGFRPVAQILEEADHNDKQEDGAYYDDQVCQISLLHVLITIVKRDGDLSPPTGEQAPAPSLSNTHFHLRLRRTVFKYSPPAMTSILYVPGCSFSVGVNFKCTRAARSVPKSASGIRSTAAKGSGSIVSNDMLMAGSTPE